MPQAPADASEAAWLSALAASDALAHVSESIFIEEEARAVRRNADLRMGKKMAETDAAIARVDELATRIGEKMRSLSSSSSGNVQEGHALRSEVGSSSTHAPARSLETAGLSMSRADNVAGHTVPCNPATDMLKTRTSPPLDGSASFVSPSARPEAALPMFPETTRTLLSECTQLAAQVASLRGALDGDKIDFVLANTYSQGLLLTDSLERAINARALAGDAERSQAAFEEKRASYVPACKRVLDALQQSVPHASADLRAKCESLVRRWSLLEERLLRPGDTASKIPITPRTTQANRLLRHRSMSHMRPRPSVAALGSPMLPPSHLPQTPSEKRSVSVRKSSNIATPTFVRNASTPRQSTSSSCPASAQQERPTSVQSDSDRIYGSYYRPPSAQSAHGERMRRRESMLPRLSLAADAGDSRATSPEPGKLRTPRQERQSLGHPATPRRTSNDLRSSYAHGGPGTPRSPAATMRTSSRISQAPPLPNSVAQMLLYMPDARDPLDVGVARVCNPRGVAVERLDASHAPTARDQLVKYSILTKTITCRLLQMVRRCARRTTHRSTARLILRTSIHTTSMCASEADGKTLRHGSTLK